MNVVLIYNLTKICLSASAFGVSPLHRNAFHGATVGVTSPSNVLLLPVCGERCVWSSRFSDFVVFVDSFKLGFLFNEHDGSDKGNREDLNKDAPNKSTSAWCVYGGGVLRLGKLQ